MDFNSATDVLQKGFHVTLGATTALFESLQDERKREENLAQLNLGFDEVTQIWAEKGAVTETEARSMLDNMVNQYAPTANTSAPTKSATPAPSGVDSELHQELRELTTQLASIRSELTQLDPNNTDS